MKKYRLLLLIIFVAFCFLLIPISYSKYFSTVRNTLRINIYDPQKAYFKEFDGSNGELYLLQDMRTYTQQFVQSLWFGAAPDGSGGTQRHIVGTLSNIVVKLER